MLSFMMTTKWATYQSAIRTWPCMNIVIFTHNLGNWLMGSCRLCGSWSAVMYGDNVAVCKRRTAAYWHTSTGDLSS